MLFSNHITAYRSRIKEYQAEVKKLLDLEKKIEAFDEEDRLATYIYILNRPRADFMVQYDTGWVKTVVDFCENKSQRLLKDDDIWKKQGYCEYMNYAEELLKDLSFEQAVYAVMASLTAIGKLT